MKFSIFIDEYSAYQQLVSCARNPTTDGLLPRRNANAPPLSRSATIVYDAAVADFDQDGDLDILIANEHRPIH